MKAVNSSAPPRHVRLFYCGKLSSAPLEDYPDKMIVEPEEVTRIAVEQEYYSKELEDGQFKRVYCGMSHCLLLTERGQLYVFGMGLRGQLGLGTETIYQREVVKVLLTPQMGQETCSILEEDAGQRSPTAGGELPPRYIRRLSIGPNSSCAIDNYHRAWVWGQNTYGNLGKLNVGKDILQPHQFKAYLLEEAEVEDDDNKSVPEQEDTEQEDPDAPPLPSNPSPRPRRVLKKISIKRIKKVQRKMPVTRFLDSAMGQHHSLFVSQVPRKMVFAIGKRARLGIGGAEADDENDEIAGEPQLVDELSSFGIKHLACGNSHSFSWNDRGDLFAWGDGSLGKLGLGADVKKRFAESQLIPTKVTTHPDGKKLRISEISAGDSTSALVTRDKRLYVWGKASYERPQFGDFESYSLPRQFLPDRPIVKVSCGMNHSAAIDDFGKLWMWGNGNEGCLGLGDQKVRQRPHLLVCMDQYHIVDVGCGDKFTSILAFSKKIQTDEKPKSRGLTRQSSTEVGSTDQDRMLKKLQAKIHGTQDQQNQRIKQQRIYSRIIERIQNRRFSYLAAASPQPQGKLIPIEDLDRQVENAPAFEPRKGSLPPIRRPAPSPELSALQRIQTLASESSAQVSGSFLPILETENSRFMDGESVTHLIHNCFNSRKNSTASSELYTKRGGQASYRAPAQMFQNMAPDTSQENITDEERMGVARFDLHQHFSTKIIDARFGKQIAKTSPEKRGELFEYFMDGVFNKNDEKPCHALARKIRLDKSKSPTKERDAVSPARSPLESKVTEYGEIERKARKLKMSKSLKKRRIPTGYYTKPDYLKKVPTMLPGDSPAMLARMERMKNRVQG